METLIYIKLYKMRAREGNSNVCTSFFYWERERSVEERVVSKITKMNIRRTLWFVWRLGETALAFSAVFCRPLVPSNPASFFFWVHCFVRAFCLRRHVVLYSLFGGRVKEKKVALWFSERYIRSYVLQMSSR